MYIIIFILFLAIGIPFAILIQKALNKIYENPYDNSGVKGSTRAIIGNFESNASLENKRKRVNKHNSRF